MAALDDHWKAAPSEGGGFFNELPEPGTYQAVFRAVDFFEQKNPPNCAFLKLVYEIVFDQKYQGREVEMVYNLEPHKQSQDAADVQRKLSFLKADLKKLGVPVDDGDFSLTMVRPGGEIWDPIMDVPVEIAVVTSKKINEKTGLNHVNVYLNARTGGPLPKGQAPIPASDIPVQLGDDTPYVPPAKASAFGDVPPPF
jgi:hypothetical protein